MKKYIRQGRRFVAIPDDPCIVGWYYNETGSFTFTQQPSSVGVVVKQTEEEFTICSIITSSPMSFEDAKRWCCTMFPKELDPRLPSREEAVALVENNWLYHKLFDITALSLETGLPYIWSESSMKRSPVCKVSLHEALSLGYGERTVMCPARTKVFLTIKR